MSFVKRSSVRDGHHWRCRICDKSVTIHKDSFFSNSNLTLQQLIIIIYGWARDFPQKKFNFAASLGESSTNTIIDWCSFCRDVCAQYLIDHPNVIGGLNENFESKIVEIDKTKYFHRKYHRGQWREDHWVFSGVERGSGKCFIVEVSDRRQETLFEISQRYIAPGTLIISDGWRAYQNINRIQSGIYEHQVIIHERYFVDPDEPDIHTQNVENLWMRAKRKLRRQFGTSEDFFPSYVERFLWRKFF